MRSRSPSLLFLLAALSLAACSSTTNGDGTDGDASTDTPAETAAASCSTNAQCPTGTICDRFAGVCAECVSAADCPPDRAACASNHCIPPIPCASTRMCPGQICDTARGFCVDCLTTVDCPMGTQCRHNVCGVPNRMCTSGRDCSISGLVCDDVTHLCVECLTDVDCDPGQSCLGNRSCVATECQMGQTQACYSGPPATRGVGACRDGSQSCTETRVWGTCQGEALPAAQDTCGNGVDDNCDGTVDEECSIDGGMDAGMDVTDAPDVRDASDIVITPDVPADRPDVSSIDTGCPASTPTPCLGGCIDASSDPLNCGICGNRCPGAFNAVAACSLGMCTITCNAGYHLCAGACVNSSDTATCGTACTPCPAPPNSTPTCDGTTCDIVCDTGYTRTGSTCTAAPRPIAPISTSYVTTRRPTLRWIHPIAGTSFRVDICSSRDCSTTLTTASVTATSFTPTADLPPGMAYWRVSTASPAMTSATWEFFVPRRSTPHDTAWGSVPDFDGDGLADIVIGSPASADMGRAYLYRGSRTGIAAAPVALTPGPAVGRFGVFTRSLGDVNGDGIGDLVVSTESARAFLFYGRTGGITGVPDGFVNAPVFTSSFPTGVAPCGDINGDGYGDAVLGTWASGGIYIYFGSSGGVSTTPNVTLTGPSDYGFGGYITCGDVNGDTYPDIVAGVPGGPTPHTRIYLGSGTGLSSTPMMIPSPDPGGAVGSSLAADGDFDGDGLSDVVIGGPGANSGNGAFWIRWGASPGSLEAHLGTGGRLGQSTASAHDVNGDGYDDLLVGATYESSYGVVYLYTGSGAGLSATPQRISSPYAGVGYFGDRTSGVGDVNGDGTTDAVMSALGAGSGAAYLYLGSGGGLPMSPSQTFNAPFATDSQFGASIASLVPRRRMVWLAMR